MSRSGDPGVEQARVTEAGGGSHGVSKADLPAPAEHLSPSGGRMHGPLGALFREPREGTIMPSMTPEPITRQEVKTRYQTDPKFHRIVDLAVAEFEQAQLDRGDRFTRDQGSLATEAAAWALLVAERFPAWAKVRDLSIESARADPKELPPHRNLKWRSLQ